MNNGQNNSYWYQRIFALLLLGLTACSNTYLSRFSEQVATAPPLGPTGEPTLLKSATPTPRLSATNTPLAQTNTPMPSLRGPLVAFVARDATGRDYTLLLDLDTGLVRRLSWDNHSPIQLNWRNDGCKLDVTVATASSVDLIVTDLRNQRPEVVFRGGKRSDGGFLTWPVVDPTGKWVAYTVLSGEQTYTGAEFQNIEVVAVGNSASPSILTTHGGASKAAWSPKGEWLSYSDFDEAGVNQLFMARPDGKEKSQLSHFTATGTSISIIQWSPGGRAITFVVHDGEGHAALWIVSIDGAKSIRVPLKDTSGHVDNLWWSKDGRTVIAYARSAIGEAQSDAIYWIDAADGVVLHTLVASDTPDRHVTQPFSVGTQILGFVGDKRIFFYDMKTGRIDDKQYAIDWADLAGPAEASPAAFQGEAACVIP